MLFGDYELYHEIARGGMGVVWKARQRRLNRTVALKMIQDGRLTNDDAVQRFLTEARAAASLDHPNIVPIYEADRVGDRHYFSMAYIEGHTLSDLVDKRGALPVQEAAAIVRAVADAIGYAHSHHIIHRDLKPSNVLIDAHGRPRVTDFGLAKCLSEVAGLTAAGQVLGTPAFMAPEQALGRNQEVGTRADIYAIGGLLYFLLTGNVPFDGDSAAEVMHQVAYEAPIPPRRVRPDVPAGLEAICLRCLEKDPDRRYARAEEIVEALAPWCAPAASTRAVPGGAPTEVAPPPRGAGNWLLPAVFVVASAAAVAAVVWYVKHLGKGPDTQVVVNPPTLGGQPPATVGSGPDGEAVDLEPKFHDFDLRVEMAGLKPDPKGEYRLKDGQELEFRVEVDRDAYVGIWSIAPNGVIHQLFPNEEEPDHLIRGKTPRVIPNPNTKVGISAEARGGVDRVLIAALTTRWDPIQAEKDGPFVVFKTKENQKKWQQGLLRDIIRKSKQIRDVQVPPKPALLSEELLRYRVEPK
jgi:tRNA A-37 threonylcarbamoyl transferase component Bud32